MHTVLRNEKTQFSSIDQLGRESCQIATTNCSSENFDRSDDPSFRNLQKCRKRKWEGERFLTKLLFPFLVTLFWYKIFVARNQKTVRISLFNILTSIWYHFVVRDRISKNCWLRGWQIRGYLCQNMRWMDDSMKPGTPLFNHNVWHGKYLKKIRSISHVCSIAWCPYHFRQCSHHNNWNSY